MKETTLCYIEKNDCYLMMHRTKKKNDANSGKWIGIGGKIENGETPLECVTREIREETSLCTSELIYRGRVLFKSDVYDDEIMHVYTATTTTSGKLMDCDEGELAWIKKSDVLSLNLWEGDRVFLEYLIKDSKDTFEITLIYEGEKLKTVVSYIEE